MSRTFTSPFHESRTLLPVMVMMNDSSFNGSALIDSGVEGNFIDEDCAQERGLPIHCLNPPIIAHSLDGRKLMTISSITSLVSVVTSSNHLEELELYLTKSSAAPLVFGRPWLSLHGPFSNWADNSVKEPLLSCTLSCFCAIFCVSFFASVGGD